MLTATDNLALVAHKILAREATGRVLGRSVPDLSLAAGRRHFAGHSTLTNSSHFYILAKEKSALTFSGHDTCYLAPSQPE